MIASKTAGRDVLLRSDAPDEQDYSAAADSNGAV